MDAINIYRYDRDFNLHVYHLQKMDSCIINPFMPNGIANPYQLDESISNLKVAG